MNIDLEKEMSVEYCENIYALGVNYLKSNSNLLLKNLLRELIALEDNIRICNDVDKLNNYKILLNQLVDRIEGIVNE